MNQEQVMGLIRHGLTFLGGFLLAKGLVDEGSMAEVSGLVMAAVGTVWSIVTKIKSIASGQ